MKKFVLVIYVCLGIVIGKPIYTFGQQSVSAKLEADILSLVNSYRESKGLALLEINEFVKGEALTHSTRMAQGKTPFSHQGYDDRFKKIEAKYKVSEGSENVAYGPNSAYKIVENWLQTDRYKENLEGNYNYTGIGVAATGNGAFYVTMIFINSPERPKIVPDEFANELLALINADRKQYKMALLEMNNQIKAEALKYTEQMAFGKVPVGPPSFDNPVKQLVNVMGGREMVELISYQLSTPQEVFDAWMNSTHQRNSIEGSYNLAGIGVVQSHDGRVFVTMILMLKR